MNLKILIFFLLTILCLQLIAYPVDQPYASYWFPNEILSWTPETDLDADYNRSNVPLKERFLNTELQVNGHARPNEAKVAALYINGPTSNNPSQGYLDIDGFTFNYWQYIDLFVFWGGSAGEGLILAPSPDIVDASHRNGVPILGTIFFPPTAYGGNIQWVNDMLQRDGDNFPVADKLIEVAEYYGFDGYFINQETAGGNSNTAIEMREFMLYFQTNSDLELMWYDSMTENGYISWQEALNGNNDMFFQHEGNLVSETMFLDFGWSSSDLQNSRLAAQNIGRSEFDLYAGVDVQANGYNTYVNWNRIFPEDEPHVTSLGFYCPNWCYSNSSDLEDYYERANEFWVGESRDPSNTNDNGTWKGVAHYIPAKSVINELPFATNFSMGQGYKYYVNGEVSGENEWYNRSLQDILPTWRWIIESTGEKLYPEIDFSDAYNGGNCLKISGNLNADNQLKLFATDLEINSNSTLDITYKTGEIGDTHMKIALAFSDMPYIYEYIDVDDTDSEDWKTTSIDLAGFSGRTLSVISLLFDSSGGADYSIKIGQIIVKNSSDVPQSASGLFVENKYEETPDIATLRLKWDHSSDNIYKYNIYRRNPDNSLTYLGGTTNNAYFVSAVNRVGGELTTTIEIEAVGNNFEKSELHSTTFDWDVSDLPLPAGDPSPYNGESDLIMNNIYLSWNPGNGSSSHDLYFGTTTNPEIVANLNQSSYALETLDANTTYYWKIDEVNSLGTTPGDLWSFTTSSAMEINVALDAVATASSQSNNSMSPAKAIDGIAGQSNGEWASNGEQNPWIELNWTESHILHKVAIYDRVNMDDHAVGGVLTFSDGTEIEYDGVPNDGSPKFVYFDPIETYSLRLQVVGGVGPNVGLSELEAYSAVNTSNDEPWNLVPKKFSLSQNYPNPFSLGNDKRSSQTKIAYDIAEKTFLEISVFNIKGQKVKTLLKSEVEPGFHCVYWNGVDEENKNVPSGIYFYRLESEKFTKTNKMLLVK